MNIEALGRIVATRGVADLQEKNEEFDAFVGACFDRYLNDDWGDLCKDDKETNDHAVRSGEEGTLACYPFPPNAPWKSDENKIWIITEWDHSVTTILFPGEY